MPWKPLNRLLPQAASGGWIVGGISGSKAIREWATAVVRMRDGAMERRMASETRETMGFTHVLGVEREKDHGIKGDTQVLASAAGQMVAPFSREEKLKQKSRVRAVGWSLRWLLTSAGMLNIYLITLHLCGLHTNSMGAAVHSCL